MKKKLIAFGLLVIFTFGISTTAFANGASQEIIPEIEMMRAINGISDVPITQELQDSVAAIFVDEEGNVIDLEPQITVRKLNAASPYSIDGETAEEYALTVVANTEKNVRDEDSYKDSLFHETAWAWATLYYTEGSGKEMTFTKADGGWKEEGNAVISNAKAERGVGLFDTNVINIPVSKLGFYTTFSVTGTRYSVKTTADVECNGKTGTLTVLASKVKN